jgi:hypothetical protein
MDDTRWDHALKVTSGGTGLVGHAGAVLLRKAADQAGLTGGDDPDLREADPDTLRYRVWHIPARLARHARERILKISPDWPRKDAFLCCWQRLCALPAPRLTSTISPSGTKGGTARRSRSRCVPGHPGHRHPATPASQTDTTPETGHQHNR